MADINMPMLKFALWSGTGVVVFQHGMAPLCDRARHDSNVLSTSRTVTNGKAVTYNNNIEKTRKTFTLGLAVFVVRLCVC